MERKLTDQELVRREKLQKLQELGVNPWGKNTKELTQVQHVKLSVKEKLMKN